MSDNQNKTDELNWAELQKQYFDALKLFNSPNPFASVANPFATGANPYAGVGNPFYSNTATENPFINNSMQQWWNTLNSQGKNAGSSNVFEKLVEQGRFYQFMAEQFSKLFDGLNASNQSDEDINDFINKKFKNLQELFANAPENMSWSGFIDPFEKPFQTIKDAVSNNLFNFSGLFDGVHPEFQKMRNQFLSIPAIGQNREIQEKLQELIKLAAIYQDHENEKQMEMARLSQEALDLMRKEIISMSKKGDKFTSMRQVYDLWVESNEKVYTEFVYSEKYSDLNGKVVNAQMAFMKMSHELNEEVLTAMNMPTTSAVNDLERRHYELRKKVKALETELKSLKENTKVKTIKQSKQVVSKERTEAVVSKTAKKKTTKKKTAQKKVSSKATKSIKSKPPKKEKKVVKKKARSKSASSSKDNAKSNVIELRF